MKYRNFFIVFVITLLMHTACKQDNYFVGGSLHDPNVNMTTYDFLKNNSRGLFDTLLIIVDSAGLKEKINQQNITFFAPTDYSINNYLTKRAIEEQEIDPFRRWTIDSLLKYEIDKVVDSIDIYIVPRLVSYQDLTQNGSVFETNKAGASTIISYESTNAEDLGHNSTSSLLPQVMYYTYLYNPLTPPIIAS
ncbi:fasciclin domain-containing protein [Olivibacter sp. XZL3]|uniref:fasciclin domain-containing protein n=1 Tax=Olivibacter sp. XZL3 TaxID=1735116 RepID=UPI0014170941|nr:fasciclin domain-containing protein [Olivibacter sp. XZL3]